MVDESYTQVEQTRQNMAMMDMDYIKLRLDTQKLHQDILNFLQGTTSIVKFDDATKTYYEAVQETGEPQANRVGIQGILSFVVAVLNPHTIQGNMKREDLDNLLYNIELGLAESFTLNYKMWGIDEDSRDHILNTLMAMIQLILSRTVDNLERPSYTPTIDKVSHVYAGNPNKNNKVV